MGVIKVKATDEFKTYRNQVLGLSKKHFRLLQEGKEILIAKNIYDKYSKIFIIRGDKDGD